MSRQHFLEKAKELLELGRQASTETGGEKVREVCLKFARNLSTIDFKLSEEMVQVFTNGNNFVPSSGAGRFNRVSPARKKKLEQQAQMQEAARAKLGISHDLEEETRKNQLPTPTPTPPTPPQVAQEAGEPQTDGQDGDNLAAVVDLALQEANEAVVQEEFDLLADPDAKTIITSTTPQLRVIYNAEAIRRLAEKFSGIYPDMGLDEYNNSRQKLSAIKRYLSEKAKAND